MSARLKAGLREILAESRADGERQANQLVRAFTAAIAATKGDRQAEGVSVTQNIYVNETSYVGQQREAARQFRQIARALT
jgi:hypothetical protein